MAKWLVCTHCGKPLTTLRVKHGAKVHLANRTVHCTGCGKISVLNGDYLSV
jgi:phage FluMu protein Com